MFIIIGLLSLNWLKLEMNKNNKKIVIWLMEGLSSQREMVIGTKQWVTASNNSNNITVIASHSQDRPEITSFADISLKEPIELKDKLDFISQINKIYHINYIHVGKNCLFYEKIRNEIEQLGITLITGAVSTDSFHLADNKWAFTNKLQAENIAVVPAKLVETIVELSYTIDEMSQKYPICVKPNNGIYGIGFWRLNNEPPASKKYFAPELFQMNTDLYLTIMAQKDNFKPLLVMPYFPGKECSIDMIVCQGQTLQSIGRRKVNGYQELFDQGEEIIMAKKCAEILNCDGLVNVQTKEDAHGKIHILEANLRPSGGFGYSAIAGINLPATLWQNRVDSNIIIEQPLHAQRIKVIDTPYIIS